MQHEQASSLNWITIYIRFHSKERSRYEIDRYLLEAGCDAAEIEAAWQNILTGKPPASLKRLKKRLKQISFLLLLLGAVLAGVWVIIVVADFVFPSMEEKLERAEQKWQSQGISSYEIEVSNVFFGPNYSVNITVKDGKVESFTCFNTGRPELHDNCTYFSPINPDNYTVSGLFSMAKDVLAKLDPKSYRVEIEFDWTFGFPSKIRTESTSGRTDTSYSRVVKSFKVLK